MKQDTEELTDSCLLNQIRLLGQYNPQTDSAHERDIIRNVVTRSVMPTIRHEMLESHSSFKTGGRWARSVEE